MAAPGSRRTLPLVGDRPVKSQPNSTRTDEVCVIGDFAMELRAFMKERNKFWLLSIVVVLVFHGSLIVMTQGSAVAPFIYALF